MGYNSGIKVFIFLFITKEKPTYCIIFLNNLYLYREFECKKMRFDELDLEDAVLDGLYDMNFDETTPVQELTIPVILEGKDIIACAQTGTGKTAAYVLPVINELSKGCHPTDAVNAVIMAPTRELAQQKLPPYCQTIMFSATMPPKIRTLAKTILKDPEEVKIAISRPPESIMQTAYICYDPQKLKILQDLFTQSRPQRVIIFSSSKMKVKELASTLKRLKFNVAAMHSDLEQSQREEVMKEFKSGHIDILVATDVVARGIDINDIKLVVNFDIPHDPEDYVHRIGRTARGTNGEGLAITFVSIDEQAQFKRIEDFLEKEVYKIPVSPEFGEVPLYEPEKYGMNKRGRGRPRKSEDKRSSSSPQKRNMGHRGRPKKVQ